MTEQVKNEQQSKHRLSLRIPNGLKETLKAEARIAGRSLNAHIVFVLENREPYLEKMSSQIATWQNGEGQG